MNKEDLKIVFMGTPEIASVILRDLNANGFTVVLGVCQPDKPVGRKQILTAPPVKNTLDELGIPSYQPNSLKNDEAFETISSYEPNLIITCAYGKILPKAVLDIPALGCLNVHASLLPAKRGSAPVQRAILDGDKETGVTIMKMDEGLDTGDIVSSVAVPIDDDIHSDELFELVGKAGSKLLTETVMPYCNGELPLIKQDESLATYCPPIKSEEGKISWDDTSFMIHKKVHALSTWPGAFTFLGGKKVKIYDTTLIDESLIPEDVRDVAPGTVVKANKRDLFVKCGEGYLGINVLQTEGGKKLNAIDCAHNFRVGQSFQDQ